MEFKNQEEFDNYVIGKEFNPNERPKEDGIQRKRNQKYLRNTIIFLIVSFLIFFSVKIGFKVYFEENGVTTFARVTEIREIDNFENRIEDYIKSYIIVYQFKTSKSKIINSNFEIRDVEFSDYFEKKVKVNDTIKIMYLPNTPKFNRIKKIK